MANRYVGLSTPEPDYSGRRDSRSSRMRPIVAALLGVLLISSCSNPTPPIGRWEGTYQSGGSFIAARLELFAGPMARISAPDVTDPNIVDDEDRIAMEQNLADRLAGAWGDVASRPMVFDGTTFRERGGTAPLIVWDQAANTMTLYVYLAAQTAIRVPLRPVADFSVNPWPRRSLGK
jgi:hypothetical protein